MKLALPISLALGGISLVIAILAAFMFYVYWISQPTLPHIDQPGNVVDIINSAEDLDRLKQVCNFLAVSQDANINIMSNQAALVKKALTFTGLLSIGLGLVAGVAFLYLHFFLRRVARDGSIAKHT